MLQTRAGRCPSCKEETPPGAEICPACGARLSWADAARRSTPASGPTPTRDDSHAHSKSVPPPFLRLFVIFLVACIATVAAVTFRSKWSKRSGAPSLQSAHATSVQDAEIFRDSIKASIGSNDAPEAALVIGVALPRQSEVLEVTVKNEWKAFDYPTRLGLAAKLAERWKIVHAPHRSYLSILDEAGNEIGGRTWNGTVWAQETHEDAPAPRPTIPPQPAAGSTPPADEAARDEAANAASGDKLDTTANAVGNGIGNSVDNSADNSVSTPTDVGAAMPPPVQSSSPAPAALDDLSNIEQQ